METEADRRFIDRTGEPDDDSDEEEDDLEDAPQAEEAEEGEEDDIDQAFKSKSTHRRAADPQILMAHAENLINKMKSAYNSDLEQLNLRKAQKNKLKMLPEVVEGFQDRELSEYLMELGGMDVLRMWLEPSPGSMVLPNARIRTEIFRVLRDINIEAEREDVKERLRKSKLGKLVMFYSKVPDELVDNRRICQRLINTWSEAIFGKMTKHTAAAEAEESERAAARGRLRVKSLAEQKAAMGGADQKRIHAFVPQAVPMDFVHRPTGGLKKDHMPKSELHREKTKRLQKKLGEITARQKKGGGRAENVSVEGRGLNVNL